MKCIDAIINTYKLDDVRAALQEVGVRGMTVAEVRGLGRQEGQTELNHGQEYRYDFHPKLEIEVVVSEPMVQVVVQAILRSARTGHTGDGKIFIMAVEKAVRIRTEEVGELAV